MSERSLRRWLLLPLLVLAFGLLSELARLFVRLDTLERLLVLLAALTTWAFINGRWLFARYHDLRASLRVRQLPAAPGFAAADRLLVIAPHPDDESLAAGGTIQQALAAGAQVQVVFLTCGDAFEWNAMVLQRVPLPGPKAMLALGERRIGEARCAARELGLPAAALTFLGYPDGGLMPLLLQHYVVPYRSPYTRATVVPYRQALAPGSAYSGRNLERDLRRVVTAFEPTRVLTCSPKDAHRDHRAAAYLSMRIFGELGQEDRLGYYIVHGAYEYPLPKGYWPNLPLYPPPRGRGLPWQRIDLTPEQVIAKAAAIHAHRSQMMVMRRFLLAFARRNELVSPLPIPVHEEILELEEEELEEWAA